MGWDGMGRDVRKKVEDALPDEQVDVPIELPLLCHMVHLKRLLHKLDKREHADYCTIRHLHNGGHLRPNWCGGSQLAKRHIQYLDGDSCVKTNKWDGG